MRRKSAVAREALTAHQIRWPMRFAKMLGKLPDAELARRREISLSAVVDERRRRGLPAYRPSRAPIHWTAAKLALLGRAVDQEVARELGVHVSSVSFQRQKLGIPAANPRRAYGPRLLFWTKSRVAKLGTMRDRELAQQLGISIGRVAQERWRRGISPFAPRRERVEWTREMRASLGKEADQRIAARYGIGIGAVRRERRRRGIAAPSSSAKIVRDEALLAKLRLSTKEAERQTGLPRATLQRLRAELGIAALTRPTAWTPDAMRRLGKVPDRALARELGLAVDTIRKRREKLGLVKRSARRWTLQEEALVMTLSVEDAAKRTQRSRRAIWNRRRVLEQRGVAFRWNP